MAAGLPGPPAGVGTAAGEERWLADRSLLATARAPCRVVDQPDGWDLVALRPRQHHRALLREGTLVVLCLLPPPGGGPDAAANARPRGPEGGKRARDSGTE